MLGTTTRRLRERRRGIWLVDAQYYFFNGTVTCQNVVEEEKMCMFKSREIIE
jgi:hypothetical protein